MGAILKIQVREMLKSQRIWSTWEDCEGADGLDESECDELIADWSKTDKELEWLRIEYRKIA